MTSGAPEKLEMYLDGIPVPSASPPLGFGVQHTVTSIGTVDEIQVPQRDAAYSNAVTASAGGVSQLVDHVMLKVAPLAGGVSAAKTATGAAQPPVVNKSSIAANPRAMRVQ